MMIKDEEIRTHLRLGEDSQWEFTRIEFGGNKPTGPRRDDLADELAAFANASGGVLLCGVEDDGTISESVPRTDCDLEPPAGRGQHRCH